MSSAGLAWNATAAHMSYLSGTFIRPRYDELSNVDCLAVQARVSGRLLRQSWPRARRGRGRIVLEFARLGKHIIDARAADADGIRHHLDRVPRLKYSVPIDPCHKVNLLFSAEGFCSFIYGQQIIPDRIIDVLLKVVPVYWLRSTFLGHGEQGELRNDLIKDGNVQVYAEIPDPVSVIIENGGCGGFGSPPRGQSLFIGAKRVLFPQQIRCAFKIRRITGFA